MTPKLLPALLLSAIGLAALPAGAMAVPPANDNYLSSLAINQRSGTKGTTIPMAPIKDSQNTLEATVQGDLFAPPASGGGVERTDCRGFTFGNTVWYDFHPRYNGTAEIQTAGFDAVVAVYEFDPRTSLIRRRVDCSNEAGVTEDLFVPVVRDRAYTVQIGGVAGPAGIAAGDLQFTFEYFSDRDRDGVFDALDKCPGTAGTAAAGGCPPRLRSTPKLRAVPTGNGIQVKSLSVSAPSKARVRVRCKRGCSYKQARTAKVVGFRGLRNRRLRAGAVIEIFVTKTRSIGNYYRYTVSRGNFKRVDRCLRPGSMRPRKRCR